MHGWNQDVSWNCCCCLSVSFCIADMESRKAFCVCALLAALASAGFTAASTTGEDEAVLASAGFAAAAGDDEPVRGERSSEVGWASSTKVHVTEGDSPSAEPSKSSMISSSSSCAPSRGRRGGCCNVGVDGRESGEGCPDDAVAEVATGARFAGGSTDTDNVSFSLQDPVSSAFQTPQVGCCPNKVKYNLKLLHIATFSSSSQSTSSLGVTGRIATITATPRGSRLGLQLRKQKFSDELLSWKWKQGKISQNSTQNKQSSSRI